MTGILEKSRKHPARETLTEAYEVRAFAEEPSAVAILDLPPQVPQSLRPDPDALQDAKARIGGHGEQRVVPDDCQFGDNDLCNPEP